MFRLLLFVALIGWSLFSLPLTLAQPISNITSASGNGTCVNSPMTNSSLLFMPLNCTIPFTLTINVDYIAYPIPPYQVNLNGPLYVRYDVDFGATNGDSSSSISFLITADPFTLPMGVPLSFSLSDSRTTAFRTLNSPLFSLLPYPMPYITSVTGCQPAATPSSMFTTLCYAETDVLTLTGQGFEPIASFYLLASSDKGVISKTALSPPTWGATIVNDSLMLLALTDTSFLLLAEHYDGRVISLALTWASGLTTGAFNVTFAAVPPPQATSWSVNLATIITNNATWGTYTYTDVRPGVSTIQVYGRWMSNLTMSVGGVQVRPYYIQGNSNSFVAPLVEPYSSQPYNATFFNLQGQSVVSSLITFAYAASVASVVPCWDDGGFTYSWRYQILHCQTNDTLTILGSRFLVAPAPPVITFKDIVGGSYALPCGKPTIVSDGVMTCIIQKPPSNWLGTVLTWNANFPTGAGFPNGQIAYPFDSDTAPRILAMTGCGGQTSRLADGLSLSGCHQGELLSLTGRNFNKSAWTGVSATRATRDAQTVTNNFYCVNVTVMSDSLVTCALPNTDDWPTMQQYLQYSLILYPYGTSFSFGAPYDKGGNSNAVYLTFGDLPSTAPPSTDQGGGSVSNTALAAGLSVGLVLLVVVVVGGLVWWGMYRKRGRDAGGEAKWWSMGDKGADSNRIELSNR